MKKKYNFNNFWVYFIFIQHFLLFNQAKRIIYFALFSMHFCRDQEQAYDTQCCLFNPLAQSSKQTNRPSQDGLVGLQRARISYKPDQPLQKSTKLILKNQKLQNSQQKQKISLSKNSARRAGTYSNDHCQKKQEAVFNVAGSIASERKLNISESKPNSSVINVDFSFNQLLPPNRPQPSQTKISFSNIPINQYPTQIKSIPKIQRKVINNEIVGSTSVPLSYRASKNVNFQYISKPEQFSTPPPFFNPNRPPQSMPEQPHNSKMVISNQQVLTNSIHNNSNLNDMDNLNIKGVQTIAPTLETDRNMVYSQVKQGNQQELQYLSPAKNNSHIFARQESQYAESRMVETVSPDLGRTHLKTVQSVYGSEMGVGKKEMQQSVILIDFFNPSEHLRKQIQDRIFSQRYPESYQ